MFISCNGNGLMVKTFFFLKNFNQDMMSLLTLSRDSLPNEINKY